MNVGRSCAQYRCAGYHVLDHRFHCPLGRRTLRRRGFQPLYDHQHLQGHCNRFLCARYPLVHTCAFLFLTFSLFAHNFRVQCWVAVRKENKSLMVAFFIVTTLFIASICSMFGSDAFRLIFQDWSFFRSLIIASLCGLVMSLCLSIWCRLRFGHGLASQRTLSLSGKPTTETDPLPLDSRS